MLINKELFDYRNYLKNGAILTYVKVKLFFKLLINHPCPLILIRFSPSLFCFVQEINLWEVFRNAFLSCKYSFVIVHLCCLLWGSLNLRTLWKGYGFKGVIIEGCENVVVNVNYFYCKCPLCMNVEINVFFLSL